MSQSPLSNRNFLFGYLGFWLIWSAMQAWILGRLGYEWQLAVSDSLISNILLAVFGFIIAGNFRYYRPKKTAIPYILVLSLGFAFFATLFIHLILKHLPIASVNYKNFLSQALPVRFCIAFLIMGLIALLSWMRYNLEEQKENDKRTAETERLAREAELFKLRQQLQPHFLFNSLNSISALTKSRPEEARRMIQQLSDFLRGTLKKEDQQQVALSEELQYLQLYLDIEKVRFGHRLNTVIEHDKESLNAILPAMLLQPIVENAIKFGLYDTTEAVTINMHAKREQNQLIITVQNPFDPETTRPAGTGFGLKSVQRRLYLLFARNDLLITEATDNLFTTTVKIPQKI